MKALNTYLLKAAKTIREEQIEQTRTVTKDATTTYYFKIQNHEIYLEITKKNNNYYQKKWGCTCTHSSGVGVKHNIECYHIIAVQTWLLMKKL